MIVSTTQTAMTGYGVAAWTAVAALIVLGGFAVGYGVAVAAIAVQRRRGDGIRLGDIAANAGVWLGRLERCSTGPVHGNVYRALRSASADELEANPHLCRKVGLRLSPVYVLRLMQQDGARGRFWAAAGGIGKPTAKRAVTVTAVPAAVV